jgi:glyoxylase-like metal-dependent hydrolase (beta-lactamase superfamily II)
MKVVAVHADVIVFVSAFWQTTCTAVRSDDEGFLIDSPVYPHELEAVPRVLEQSSFPVTGLLATHADWDHLLGRHAFPQASLGCGEPTVDALNARPGQAQRELREFDDEHYVAGRPPLSLGAIQPLPVPGRLDLGSQGRELELHPASGHTADGTAYFMRWLEVLVCGDYLSPVEIPWISPGGSLPAYEEALERLRGLVSDATTVIPGHGGPLASEQAMSVLEEDLTYLQALSRKGSEASLPPTRRTKAQLRIHAENVAAISPVGPG